MIQLNEVSKTYGDLPVLEGVSLSIEPGEIVSLVGPSGCGKTTLLKIVMGLASPTAGTCLIDNLPAAQSRRSGKLGYVLQNPLLLPWRSVLENVALPLELKGIDRKRREEAAIEMLHLLGLAAFAQTKPEHLSGGMKQRAAIARALIFKPATLVMDEPFGALDELMRESFDVELRKLAKELKQTVVFVTHSLWEAVLISDKAVVLSPRPGRVRAILTIDLPNSRAAEVGSPRHAELVQHLRAVMKEDQ